MLFSHTFYSYYVRWIEASGARVVAIPWDVTPDRLQWYASRVNAVLFPGGGLEDGATMSAYFSNVILWHDTSIELSKQGRRLVSREAEPAETPQTTHIFSRSFGEPVKDFKCFVQQLRAISLSLKKTLCTGCILSCCPSTLPRPARPVECWAPRPPPQTF